MLCQRLHSTVRKALDRTLDVLLLLPSKSRVPLYAGSDGIQQCRVSQASQRIGRLLYSLPPASNRSGEDQLQLLLYQQMLSGDFLAVGAGIHRFRLSHRLKPLDLERHRVLPGQHPGIMRHTYCRSHLLPLAGIGFDAVGQQHIEAMLCVRCQALRLGDQRQGIESITGAGQPAETDERQRKHALLQLLGVILADVCVIEVQLHDPGTLDLTHLVPCPAGQQLHLCLEPGSWFEVWDVVLRYVHRQTSLDVAAGLCCPLPGSESAEAADEHRLACGQCLLDSLQRSFNCYQDIDF